MIGEAIKNYDPNIAKDISLQFALKLLNPKNYDGNIVVNFKLIAGMPITFGDIDLTNKVVSLIL